MANKMATAGCSQRTCGRQATGREAGLRRKRRDSGPRDGMRRTILGRTVQPGVLEPLRVGRALASCFSSLQRCCCYGCYGVTLLAWIFKSACCLYAADPDSVRRSGKKKMIRVARNNRKHPSEGARFFSPSWQCSC